MTTRSVARRDQAHARLELVARSAAMLLTAARPGKVIREIFDHLAAHLGLEVYLNFLVTEEGTALRLDSCAGIPEAMLPSLQQLQFGEAICGTVAACRSRIVAEDIVHSGDPLARLVRSLGIQAYACHPLTANDRLIGTLSFGTRRRPRFAPDELQLLEMVSNHVAVALERTRLIDELRREVAARARAEVEIIALLARERVARADAEDATLAKDEFLALLGHELRNPLAAIQSATGILQKLAPVDSRARWAVEVVARQGHHLSRMVGDLLDVSRLRRGTLEIHRQPVPLHTVIAHAIETVRPELDRRHHELAVQLPAEPIALEADPVRLAQALANLLDNAARYTPAGGQITLVAERSGAEARVEVCDTGIGIPPDRMGRIFDLCGPGEGPPATSAGGLGLGLTLVRNLVELHGGRVAAASEGPGRGSTFTVRLPVRPGPPAPDRAVPAAATPPARRILIVEDDEDVADSLAVALRLDGHMVSVARDGRAGLESFRLFQPDVVVVDAGLPGISGWEVARRMRAESARPELAIITVSGYGQEADRRRSRDAGCDAHLVKPIDPDALRVYLAGAGAARVGLPGGRLAGPGAFTPSRAALRRASRDRPA